MAWRFVLAELPVSATATVGGNIGEIGNAHEKQVTLPLNGLATASCSVRWDDPLVSEIITRDGLVILKVYDNASTLRFLGRLIGGDIQGDASGQSIKLTFASLPLLVLSKRVMGASATGYARTDTARDAIVNELLFGVGGTSTEWSANYVYDTQIRKGTFDSLEPTSVGDDEPIRFKPVSEMLTEMQAAKTPPYTARDDFAASSYVTVSQLIIGLGSQSGCLDGQALQFPSGTTWEDPTNPTTNAERSASFVAYDENGFRLAGRSAFDGAANTAYHFLYTTPEVALADVVVEADFVAKVVSPYLEMGVLLRYDQATGAAVIAYGNYNPATGHPALWVLKRTSSAGAWTTLSGPTDVGESWIADVPLKIRATVNSTGDWTAQIYGGQATTPLVSGNDSALAAGAALGTAAGSYGLVDRFKVNSGTVATTVRGWDNVKVYDPTALPVSFDFEFVPSEPTADSNADGVVGNGVKVATMNLRQTIGTDRPNVVLEFAGGNRAAKRFSWSMSFDGLITRAHSLPVDWPTDTNVQAFTDTDALAAQGLWEEVIPTTDTSPLLRAALVEANVRLRKQARNIIAISPMPGGPQFGTDYFIGDTITARVFRLGTAVFEGTVRVYGIEYSSDDEGKEDVTPVLVPQE